MTKLTFTCLRFILRVIIAESHSLCCCSTAYRNYGGGGAFLIAHAVKWSFHFLTRKGCTKNLRLCLMNEWHHKLGPDTARSAAVVFVSPLRSSCSQFVRFLSPCIRWLKTPSAAGQWKAIHTRYIWLPVPQGSDPQTNVPAVSEAEISWSWCPMQCCIQTINARARFHRPLVTSVNSLAHCSRGWL